MQIFIDSIRKDIEALNWHGALAQSLILPDICGNIDTPSEGSGARYANWFEQYVAPKYELSPNSPSRTRGLINLLVGKDVYALRCSYLHEGSDEISHQRIREVFDRFRFSSRPNIHRNVITVGEIVTVQLNISEFCNDIISGVEQWLRDIANDADKQEKITSRINIDLDPHQPGGLTFGPAEDQQFNGQKIVVDGNTFRRCIFTNCQLVFKGTSPFNMEGCTIRESTIWQFEGPSMQTIGFLSGLYQEGEGGRKTVENIFLQIQDGKILKTDKS